MFALAGSHCTDTQLGVCADILRGSLKSWCDYALTALRVSDFLPTVFEFLYCSDLWMVNSGRRPEQLAFRGYLQPYLKAQTQACVNMINNALPCAIAGVWTLLGMKSAILRVHKAAATGS